MVVRSVEKVLTFSILTVSLPMGVWILARHSALLALFTCVVGSPGARCTTSFEVTTIQVAASALVQPQYSINWSSATPPSQPARLSQFIQWKNRRKAVLEQTWKWFPELSELGSVVLPNRLIPFAPIESPRNCLATNPPLRC
jgi:hypothetical protein